MAKSPIVKNPHKVLRARAEEVLVRDIATPKIQKLLQDMKDTLAATPDGVGLAAPQIGVGMRIFIVSDESEEIDKVRKRRWEEEHGSELKRKKDKPYESRDWNYHVYINPTVKKLSKSKIEDAEGCLSVPGVFGVVGRHEKITVEAHDEHGKKFTRGASNFYARVLQHELDHLNGTLFIDKTRQILEPAKE